MANSSSHLETFEESSVRAQILGQMLEEQRTGLHSVSGTQRSQQPPSELLSGRPAFEQMEAAMLNVPQDAPCLNGSTQGDALCPNGSTQGDVLCPNGSTQGDALCPNGSTQGVALSPNGSTQGDALCPNGSTQGDALSPNGSTQGDALCPNGSTQGDALSPNGSTQGDALCPNGSTQGDALSLTGSTQGDALSLNGSTQGDALSPNGSTQGDALSLIGFTQGDALSPNGSPQDDALCPNGSTQGNALSSNGSTQGDALCPDVSRQDNDLSPGVNADMSPDVSPRDSVFSSDILAEEPAMSLDVSKQDPTMPPKEPAMSIDVPRHEAIMSPDVSTQESKQDPDITPNVSTQKSSVYPDGSIQNPPLSPDTADQSPSKSCWSKIQEVLQKKRTKKYVREILTIPTDCSIGGDERETNDHTLREEEADTASSTPPGAQSETVDPPSVSSIIPIPIETGRAFIDRTSHQPELGDVGVNTVCSPSATSSSKSGREAYSSFTWSRDKTRYVNPDLKKKRGAHPYFTCQSDKSKYYGSTSSLKKTSCTPFKFEGRPNSSSGKKTSQTRRRDEEQNKLSQRQLEGAKCVPTSHTSPDALTGTSSSSKEEVKEKIEMSYYALNRAQLTLEAMDKNDSRYKAMEKLYLPLRAKYLSLLADQKCLDVVEASMINSANTLPDVHRTDEYRKATTVSGIPTDAVARPHHPFEPETKKETMCEMPAAVVPFDKDTVEQAPPVQPDIVQTSKELEEGELVEPDTPSVFSRLGKKRGKDKCHSTGACNTRPDALGVLSSNHPRPDSADNPRGNLTRETYWRADDPLHEVGSRGSSYYDHFRDYDTPVECHTQSVRGDLRTVLDMMADGRNFWDENYHETQRCCNYEDEASMKNDRSDYHSMHREKRGQKRFHSDGGSGKFSRSDEGRDFDEGLIPHVQGEVKRTRRWEVTAESFPEGIESRLNHEGHHLRRSRARGREPQRGVTRGRQNYGRSRSSFHKGQHHQDRHFSRSRGGANQNSPPGRNNWSGYKFEEEPESITRTQKTSISKGYRDRRSEQNVILVDSIGECDEMDFLPCSSRQNSVRESDEWNHGQEFENSGGAGMYLGRQGSFHSGPVDASPSRDRRRSGPVDASSSRDRRRSGHARQNETRIISDSQIKGVVVAEASALINGELLQCLFKHLEKSSLRLDIHSQCYRKLKDVRRDRPSEDNVAQILEKCFDIIDYYHRKGIVNIIGNCSCRDKKEVDIAQLVKCSHERFGQPGGSLQWIILTGPILKPMEENEENSAAYPGVKFLSIPDIKLTPDDQP